MSSTALPAESSLSPARRTLPAPLLLPLTALNKVDFGRHPILAAHNLQHSELFTDAALIELLDRFPRRNLFALTMGRDPARPEDNQLAVNNGVSGAELLRAVRNGRLWLNVTRIDRVEPRYRDLIDRLYGELAAQVPGFVPDWSQGTLLISSPHALVYYHADGPASVLWHLRGRKQVWVYPALDPRYVERIALEDIFAGARHEYLPFDPAFDRNAQVYELEPGDWIAWAQNAPHRVTNLDSVNVSLSTEHFTRASRRRASVYCANRFLRTRLGRPQSSLREEGGAALLKTFAYRLVRAAGLDRPEAKRHTPTLRVDADAPGGVVPLTGVSGAVTAAQKPADPLSILPTAAAAELPRMLQTESLPKLSTELPTKRPTKRSTEVPTELPTELPTEIQTKLPIENSTEFPTASSTSLRAFLPSPSTTADVATVSLGAPTVETATEVVAEQSSISVRCFDSLAAAEFLRADVDALNRVSSRPDPFSTFEFFENFLRHDQFFPAGMGLRLWFLTAFRDDRLVGYMALKEVPHNVFGVKTRTLGFLVTHDTDRPHAVARSEDLREVGAALCAHLLERKSEWSFLELQQQDDASALFPLPAGIAFDGYLVREWPSLENCTIHLRWDSMREYFRSLSKKFRSNLRRQMRLLLAAGKVEFIASDDPAATPALFELYRSIEPRSWKSLANANIGRHPEQIEYFKGLLDARQPMRVTIHILLLNGVPVAGLISGSFMTGMYALHIVYDGRLSHLAPGSAMLLMGMRQAIEGSYAFFNLLSGFGYYKVRWLAQVTETRIAQIYRAGGLRYWRRLLGDWKRWVLAERVKKLPLLFNPARRDVNRRHGEMLDDPSGAPPRHRTRTPSGKHPDGRKLPQIQLPIGERERIAALIGTVRSRPNEYLSAADLAVILPLEVESAVPIEKRRTRPPSTSGTTVSSHLH